MNEAASSVKAELLRILRQHIPAAHVDYDTAHTLVDLLSLTPTIDASVARLAARAETTVEIDPTPADEPTPAELYPDGILPPATDET